MLIKNTVIITDKTNKDYLVKEIKLDTIFLQEVGTAKYKIMPFTSFDNLFEEALIFKIGGHKIKRQQSNFIFIECS